MIRRRRRGSEPLPHEPASPCSRSWRKRRPDLTNPRTAFDAAAATYDDQFTHTSIGELMRQAVWRRLAVRFRPGSRILEMNCGTGEDAVWMAERGISVLATDISPQMLRVAREKLAKAHAAPEVRLQQLAWETLDSLDEPPFDGVLSNFGGLNCVQDLRAVVPALARCVKPGGVAVLCVMGRLVPWEWLWFLAQGKPASAFRRLKSGGAVWSGVRVAYPSVADLRTALEPEFAVARTSAIGALVPPPYSEKYLGRFRRVLSVLNSVERRCETWWPLPHLADHYLMELVRV